MGLINEEFVIDISWEQYYFSPCRVGSWALTGVRLISLHAQNDEKKKKTPIKRDTHNHGEEQDWRDPVKVLASL